MVGIGDDEDISGRRIGDFSPAWARERVRGEALAAARRDGVWRGDLARLHRDGHEIPIVAGDHRAASTETARSTSTRRSRAT